MNLATEALAVSCFIDKNGVLTVESLGAPDGSWKSPFTGPLYPGSGDCKYHEAPVAIRRKNGDSSLQLIYQGNTAPTSLTASGKRSSPCVTGCSPSSWTCISSSTPARTSSSNPRVIRNGLDAPLQVERLDSAFWQTPSAAAPHIEWYDSRWGDEAQPNKEKLAKGRRLIENRTGTAISRAPSPPSSCPSAGLPMRRNPRA